MFIQLHTVIHLNNTQDKSFQGKCRETTERLCIQDTSFVRFVVLSLSGVCVFIFYQVAEAGS